MWLAAWGIVGLALVATMITPPVRLPADGLGLREFVVPIDQETAVSQTFAMTADGLRAVAVEPAALSAAPSGKVRFELTEEGSGVVRSGDVAAASLLSSASYVLEFAPIDDSKDAVFRLELMSSATDPARGIGVRATKGARYAGGAMEINGRERWADLAFRAVAPGARSTWDRLMAMELPPPGLSRRSVILTALALYWLAAGFVLRMVWRVKEGTVL
jgi:hypothetical protein